MLEMSNNGAGSREAARAGGERSAPAAGRAAPAGVPDPELAQRPKRRRFSAEYKLAILREAEACSRPGEVGALLRREGLYTSHLSAWRRQRDAGALKELGRPRGRTPADRREREIVELRRRTERLERAEAELAKARTVIEIQGNVSALLEQMLSTEGASKPGSTER